MEHSTEKINCEAMFCVYCDNGCCTLDSISVNAVGQCEDLLLVDVPPEVLEEAKGKMFENWAKDFD